MMKAFSGLFLFLLFLLAMPTTVVAFGKLQGSVAGLDTGNSHLVAEREGAVYRGAEPGKDVEALTGFGITDVLIIKRSTRGEVEKEIAALQEAGIGKTRIKHFPMEWNTPGQFKATCQQMIGALKIAGGILAKPGRKLYFHCTAGEDRTGALAGLVRMLEEGLSAKQAFKDELCARGYAEGNPRKPARVDQQIHDNLTPVFARLSAAIEGGELSWDNLDESVCDQAPEAMAASAWRCR